MTIFQASAAVFLLFLSQNEPEPAAIKICKTLVQERKWKEARTKAEAFLLQKDLKGPVRAEVELILAKCHEAANEFEGAMAACGRALQENEFSGRGEAHAIQGRAQLGLKDARGALATFVRGLEEIESDKVRSRRWSGVLAIVRGIDQISNLQALLDAAEAQAAGGGPALQAVLGVCRLARRNNPKGAVAALEKACAAWKDDLVLFRWEIRAVIASGNLERALAMRAELIAMTAAEKPNLAREPILEMPGQINQDLANAAIRGKDEAFARKYARVVSEEPVAHDTHLVVGTLLGFLKDEALILEINDFLVKRATDEWSRFHALFPAADAWRAMGRKDKAIAHYRQVTEANGFSKGYVEMAQRWIEDWERKP